jgi:hypothetical protein
LLPGNRIVALGRQPDRPARSWVQDVTGGRPRPVTPEGQLVEAVSPDGAVAVARDGDRHLLLYSVDGGTPRRAAGPPETGDIMAWSADGTALFIREVDTARGPAVRLFRRELATGRRELWKELLPSDQTGLIDFQSTVSSDGRATSQRARQRGRNARGECEEARGVVSVCREALRSRPRGSDRLLARTAPRAGGHPGGGHAAGPRELQVHVGRGRASCQPSPAPLRGSGR